MQLELNLRRPPGKLTAAMTSLFLTESDGNESLDSYVIQTHSKTYLLMRWNLAGKGDTRLWIHIIDREPSYSFIIVVLI